MNPPIIVENKCNQHRFLIGLVILFSIISPNFITQRNIIILIRQVSFAAISAVGVGFVMISGGIDLSIGSQIVMTNVVLAIMIAYWNLPMSVAIPLTLLLGTTLGRQQRRSRPSRTCPV